MFLRVVGLEHACVEKRTNHEDLAQEVRLLDSAGSICQVLMLSLLGLNLLLELTILSLDLLDCLLCVLDLGFGFFDFLMLFLDLRF